MAMLARQAEPRARDVMWVAEQGDGFEHVFLGRSGDGWLADGLIVRDDPAGTLRLRYAIETDADWRTTRARVWSLDDPDRATELRSEMPGAWTDAAGAPLPALHGALDVDLHASPFTNTLAIRRLQLAPGESRDITAVFVTIPSLDAAAEPQRYTLLQRTPAGDTFRYDGLSSGFTAELPADADGLLLAYPGWFRRAWNR